MTEMNDIKEIANTQSKHIRPWIGIDYSSHKIDIVGALDGKYVFGKEFVIRKSEKFENIHLLRAFHCVRNFIGHWHKYSNCIPFICMEQPIIHRTHRSSNTMMSMLGGALLSGMGFAVVEHQKFFDKPIDIDFMTEGPEVFINKKFMQIPPSSWKKEVIDNGNASKEDIKNWVKENYSKSTYNKLISNKKYGSEQDLLDAFCIALYRERIFNKNGE